MIMSEKTKYSRSAFTILEIVIALAVSMILVLVVCALTASGNRAWLNAYAFGSSGQVDQARNSLTSFTSIGQKASIDHTFLYHRNSSLYVQVDPSAQTGTVTAQAVEFRYWDKQEQNFNQSAPNRYAFFYVQDGDLMVDYGRYPPGAVLNDSTRNRDDIITMLLAEEVEVPPGTKGPFIQTAESGALTGAIRLNLRMENPPWGQAPHITAATRPQNHVSK